MFKDFLISWEMGKLKGIMFLSLIAIIGFCSLPVNAGAEIWTHLDSDDTGKWYYDKDSLARTRTGTVVFWVKVAYSRDALQELLTEEKRKGTYTKSYDSWNYSMFNYACECDKLTCGLQSSIAYDTSGAILKTYSAGPVTEKWEKFRAGSILDKFISDICKTK
jgi:hypothetical protein